MSPGGGWRPPIPVPASTGRALRAQTSRRTESPRITALWETHWKRVCLVAAAIYLSRPFGVLTPNTDDRALGRVIISGSRARFLLPFGRDWSFRYAISGAEGQTAGGEVYDRVAH